MTSRNRDAAESLALLTAIVVTATFGARASNSVIPSYMQILGRLFTFSELEIGLMAVAFMVSSFISSAFINARLDIVKRRWFFIISAALYAAVYPLFYFASPVTVWVIAFVAGFAIGPIMPNIMTSAGMVTDRRARERLLAIYTLTLSVSLLVAQALAGGVLKYINVREAFLAMEPLALLVAISAPFLRFRMPQGVQAKDAPGMNKVSAKEVITNAGFLASVLNNLTYQVPFSFLVTFAVVFAEQAFGASGSLAVLSYVPFYATSLLSRLLMSIRPPQNLLRQMVLAPSVTIIGLLVAWQARTLAFFFVAMAILGVPHGITYTLSVLAISRTFRAERLNAANSYFFSTMIILGSALPAILGAAADAVGLREIYLLLVPVVIAVLGATLVFARKTAQLRSPVESIEASVAA